MYVSNRKYFSLRLFQNSCGSDGEITKYHKVTCVVSYQVTYKYSSIIYLFNRSMTYIFLGVNMPCCVGSFNIIIYFKSENAIDSSTLSR